MVNFSEIELSTWSTPSSTREDVVVDFHLERSTTAFFTHCFLHTSIVTEVPDCILMRGDTEVIKITSELQNICTKLNYPDKTITKSAKSHPIFFTMLSMMYATGRQPHSLRVVFKNMDMSRESEFNAKVVLYRTESLLCVKSQPVSVPDYFLVDSKGPCTVYKITPRGKVKNILIWRKDVDGAEASDYKVTLKANGVEVNDGPVRAYVYSQLLPIKQVPLCLSFNQWDPSGGTVSDFLTIKIEEDVSYSDHVPAEYNVVLIYETLNHVTAS